ncbi:GAS6 protein, partial [Polyodon spathula]|nr:GAS6 protein [Polyodon spathula]
QVLSQRHASQFLTRRRRANSLFEEHRKGNLERECIEELCNKEEAREVFENDSETDYFYPKYVACLGSYRVGILNSPLPPSSEAPATLRACVKEISNQCSPLPCHREGYEKCVDGKGRYDCICKPGWRGERCEEDINECEDPEALASCNQKCYNDLGGFRCLCEDGYYLLTDKQTCTDFNECAMYPSICGSASCINTPGKYECACAGEGYRYNFTSQTCEDVDECTVSPDVCGTAQCLNSIGSFECLCDGGYFYDNITKSCLDVDECESKSCAGSCVNTLGSYQCYCNGRNGVKLAADLTSCESIEPCVSLNTQRSVKSLYLGRMFSGAPVIRLRFRRKQHIGFTAEFDFRTFDPEGVIFFTGGHLNSSWIVLAINQGKLELQLKYGEVRRVTSSGPLVNNGLWHRISVEEQGRSLIIKINREAVMKIAVNGDLFTLKKGLHELNLTVGGVPFKGEELVNPLNPRLDGCIRDWSWLNGEDTSIQETIKFNEKMQCFSVTGSGSFYPGNGFALLNVSYSDPKGAWTVNVFMNIRPSASPGVLFALVSGEGVPLTLALTDYHPAKKVRAQHVVLAVGDAIVSSVGVEVCDADTHSVSITVRKDLISLEVDGMAGQSEFNSAELEQHITNLGTDLQGPVNTYLGGVPDVPVSSTAVSAFYRGCMDLHINGKEVDLDEALLKHSDIRSHSCPPAESGQIL